MLPGRWTDRKILIWPSCRDGSEQAEEIYRTACACFAGWTAKRDISKALALLDQAANMGNSNAGGLDTEKDPIGKTFTLVDEHGLKAKLEVRWKVFTTKRQMAYYAFGTIEEYTSARIRRIEISSIEDNKIRLFTRLEDDDQEAFAAHPLWQEYLKETNQWYKLQEEMTQRLIDRYAEQAL